MEGRGALLFVAFHAVWIVRVARDASSFAVIVTTLGKMTEMS
jgi:hypothetical protein